MNWLHKIKILDLAHFESILPIYLYQGILFTSSDAYGIMEWIILEGEFRAVWQTTGGWGRQGFGAFAWSKWCFRKCKHSGRLLFYNSLSQVETFDGDNLCPALKASKPETTTWKVNNGPETSSKCCQLINFSYLVIEEIPPFYVEMARETQKDFSKFQILWSTFKLASQVNYWWFLFAARDRPYIT